MIANVVHFLFFPHIFMTVGSDDAPPLLAEMAPCSICLYTSWPDLLFFFSSLSSLVGSSNGEIAQRLARSDEAIQVLGGYHLKEDKESNDLHWLDCFDEPGSPRNDGAGGWR